MNVPPEDNICIALIDDSVRLRESIGDYLSTHGFTILLEADNGQQLLEKLETVSRLPDMCLLDTNMPVMNGYETAKQLKVKYPSVKILAYSFFDNDDSSELMMKCGALDCISKDASAQEVKEALLRLNNEFNAADA